MDAKRFLTTTIVATGLVALTAGPALAEPPPWAGVWKNKSRDVTRYDHRRHHRHDRYCRHDDHRRHRDRTRFDRRDFGRYDRFDRLGSLNDPAYAGRSCRKVITKIRRAREGLARWGGTNRHEDAQQDWRRNLNNASRDLSECRARDARRAYDRYDQYDRSGYDPYYDPYYDGGGYGTRLGADFEWKRDWPLIVGPLLGGFGN